MNIKTGFKLYFYLKLTHLKEFISFFLLNVYRFIFSPVSPAELRRIKKNLKKGKQSFREPLNDQTQIMIAVGIKIASILAIGLIAILIIVKFM